jgi:hypothetical protein
VRLDLTKHNRNRIALTNESSGFFGTYLHDSGNGAAPHCKFLTESEVVGSMCHTVKENGNDPTRLDHLSGLPACFQFVLSLSRNGVSSSTKVSNDSPLILKHFFHRTGSYTGSIQKSSHHVKLLDFT